MNEPVLYEQRGHVATLTLNRPATRNALTDADIVEEFVSACLRVNADKNIRVVMPSTTSANRSLRAARGAT